MTADTTKMYDQSLLNKARVDKFILSLTLPNALREVNTKNDRNNTNVIQDSLQFSVYGVEIPKVAVADVEGRYSGQTFHFTSHKRPAYDNVNVKFTIDNQFNNYWVIYKWINLLNNNQEGFFHAESIPIVELPYELYSTNITVFGLDEYDNRVIQFDFIGVIPVSLGGITYNYRDSSEIETEFDFSFSQLIAKLL
jgi:hypothetical protein